MVVYYKQDFKKYLENQGDYDYAIIDPPWNYDSKPTAVMVNQLTYDLWDNADLKKVFEQLNVNYIFLWVTNSFIPNAILAAEGTEFKYKTICTWVKLTVKDHLFWGLGNTFRNCTEHVMVFQKDKAPCLNLNIRNCVMAQASKRTIKPKLFEKGLVEILNKKDLKGIYLFSGVELDFIDSLDIV